MTIFSSFTEPSELLLLGGVIGLAGKFIWDRWLSKRSRLTLDDCTRIRTACIAGRNENLERVLGVRDVRLKDGEDEFECIGTQLRKIRNILEAVLEIQLKICETNPDIDCKDLIKTLAKKGLEFNEDE